MSDTSERCRKCGSENGYDSFWRDADDPHYTCGRCGEREKPHPEDKAEKVPMTAEQEGDFPKAPGRPDNPNFSESAKWYDQGYARGRKSMENFLKEMTIERDALKARMECIERYDQERPKLADKVVALEAELERVRQHLKNALDHAEEHSEGCLFCGEGEIIDGEIAEEHKKDCWYYKAIRIVEEALSTPATQEGTKQS